MADYFANGDTRLPIRNKINALSGCMKVFETDVLISAGATTSVPVVTLTKSILPTGYTVILVDANTGDQHTLTLDAAALNADTALTIVSYTFPSDIPVGSFIYVNIIDILNTLYYSA